MSFVIVLFALSLMIGFTLRRFSWRAIALSTLALAVLAAVVLHRQGFGPLAGIAIIVACLTINQMAYLVGVRSVDRRSGSLWSVLACAQDLIENADPEALSS
jgi:hypothetical protein